MGSQSVQHDWATFASLSLPRRIEVSISDGYIRFGRARNGNSCSSYAKWFTWVDLFNLDKLGAQVLSHVRLFATPWTVAHQAPLSMGFSWASILGSVAISSSRGSSQFRDLTCVSCNWHADSLPLAPPGKLQVGKRKVEVAQSCTTLCDRMDCSPPGSSVHGIFLAKMLEWVAICFSRRTLLTQGSNLDLLHCRQILYCQSPKEAPDI